MHFHALGNDVAVNVVLHQIYKRHLFCRLKSAADVVVHRLDLMHLVRDTQMLKKFEIFGFNFFVLIFFLWIYFFFPTYMRPVIFSVAIECPTVQRSYFPNCGRPLQPDCMSPKIQSLQFLCYGIDKSTNGNIYFNI